MSNRLNIRKKKVKKLPYGKFIYQVVLKFKPDFYKNNHNSYLNMREFLQNTAIMDWHIPRAYPPAFYKHIPSYRRSYLRGDRSAQTVFLQDGMDLAMFKLCFLEDIKNIYELELIS